MLKSYKELKDLGYIKSDDIQELQQEIGEVERMLKALIKSLQGKHSNLPLAASRFRISALRSGT